jgi:predicted Zn-dependent protease
VNKDHVLFLVIGLLGGFLLGYVGHEVMASRQPAPASAGGAAAVAPPQGGVPQGGGEGGPAAGGGGGPAMEQVQQLRAYVEKNPNDARAVRELANLNYDINNWQRAAELYEQYLKLQPGEVDVMTDLGACLRNMGKSAEALAWLQKATAKAPDHWQALYNQVLILGFDLGRMNEAAAAAAELRKLQPNNPDVTRLADEIERRHAAGA